MHEKSRARSLAVLLCSLLLCAQASAAPPEEGERHHHRRGQKDPAPAPETVVPVRTATQVATELTDQAYQLQRRGSFNDAIKLYMEALRVDPAPKRHYNLAIPLEQAGRLAEALREYRAFQRDELGEQPEHRREVDSRVARLLREFGRVELFPVHDEAALFTTRVAEAISDRPRCLQEEDTDTVHGYTCQPGAVHAELVLHGTVVARRVATVAAGSAVRVEFRARGPVRISGNRAAPDLLLDGAPLYLGKRLPRVVPLLLGPHLIQARDGRESIERRFNVPDLDGGAAGPAARVDLRFSPSRKWIYWVAAAGVVVITAGVLGGVLSRPAPAGGADIHL